MLEQDYETYKKIQGQRIRLIRKIVGLTQPGLAEAMTAELGFYFGDDVKVSRIERGKQDVTGRELAALSVVLGQPAAWLQGVEDENDYTLTEFAKNPLFIPLGLTTHRPLAVAA